MCEQAKSIKRKGRRKVVNKLLGAAAVAAMVYAFVPAYGAKVVLVGCSGENLGSTESAVESMADGPAKIMAQKEIAQAQDAMLNGKMGGCAVHLSRAKRATTMTQGPYPGSFAQAPYTNTFAQAPIPGATQGPSQAPYQGPAQPTNQAPYQSQPT
jgi:hypothetical protein